MHQMLRSGVCNELHDLIIKPFGPKWVQVQQFSKGSLKSNVGM